MSALPYTTPAMPVCELCKKKFSHRSKLVRHSREIHAVRLPTAPRSKTMVCQSCSGSFTTNDLFIEHIRDEHDIKVVEETLSFESNASFDEWKQSVESCSPVKFVIRDRMNTKNSKVIYYHCNRAGFFNARISNSDRKRKLKMQGSRKINSHCPARMTVSQLSDGRVNVKYIASHFGHELQLVHVPISPATKVQVAAKLASEIPLHYVLDDVRNGMNRDRIITLQDLHNIQRDYLNAENKHHLSRPPTLIQPPPPPPLSLPKFDPAKDDATTWLGASQMLIESRPALSTPELVQAVTKAFEGTLASQWLDGILSPTLEWGEFHTLFELQYGAIDTPASECYRALVGRQDDQSSFIAEQLTRLRALMKNRPSDEIVLHFLTALAARNEPEIRRWALTDDNPTAPELISRLKTVKMVKSQQPTTGSQPQRGRGGSSGPSGPPLKRDSPGPSSAPPSKRGRFESRAAPPATTPVQPSQHPQQHCNKDKSPHHSSAQFSLKPRRQRRGRGQARTSQAAPRQLQTPPERKVRQVDAAPTGSLSHQDSPPGVPYLKPGSACLDVKERSKMTLKAEQVPREI